MVDLKEVSEWFQGRDTGLSSQAIAWHMISGYSKGYTPSDPSDLGRCLRLLERFPEWKLRLPEMSSYSDDWARLVDNWATLERTMKEEVGISWEKGKRAEKTYNLMRTIFNSPKSNNE